MMTRPTRRLASVVMATAFAGGSFVLATASTQVSAEQNEDPVVIMADQEYPPVIGR